MSDAGYDVVVAGGGHHAMIIAPYLARAGLSVLVLDLPAIAAAGHGLLTAGVEGLPAELLEPFELPRRRFVSLRHRRGA